MPTTTTTTYDECPVCLGVPCCCDTPTTLNGTASNPFPYALPPPNNGGCMTCDTVGNNSISFTLTRDATNDDWRGTATTTGNCTIAATVYFILRCRGLGVWELGATCAAGGYSAITSFTVTTTSSCSPFVLTWHKFATAIFDCCGFGASGVDDITITS